MPVITLANENKTIEAPVGANLRRVLLNNGVSPYIGLAKLINCRGFEMCGTCRVEVVDGKGASARRDDEERTLISIRRFTHAGLKRIFACPARHRSPGI